MNAHVPSDGKTDGSSGYSAAGWQDADRWIECRVAPGDTCVVAPTQPSGRACGLDRSCHLGSNSPNYSCVDQPLKLVECPVLAHLCPLNLSLRRSANGWKAEIGQRSSSRDMPRPRCRARHVTTAGAGPTSLPSPITVPAARSANRPAGLRTAVYTNARSRRWRWGRRRLA